MLVQKSEKEPEEGEQEWSRQIGELEEPEGERSEEIEVEREGE